jgi:diguanylate cyclase (GGDEF)-like protein
MPETAGYPADRALAALLEALDEGVLAFDAHGVCRAVGRRAGEIFGVDPASLVGLGRDAVLARLAPSVSGDALAALRTGALVALAGERTVVDPIEVERPQPRLVAWTSLPAGEGLGRLDVVRDVTRERRAEERAADLGRRLELESTLDDLTGLTNRRQFEDASGREHRRAQREWVSYAVARVDVDGMGALNAALGVARGDELLRAVAEELRATRREYDVVARWVDDEFVLLLPRADGAAIRKVLRRAVDGVHEKGRLLAPGMSVSVGAAIWSPPSAEGPGDVLHRAADALARARSRGPGHIEIDAGSSDWEGDMG